MTLSPQQFSGREWRRHQANERAKAEGFTHATTHTKHGPVTLHKVECPVVQRVFGSLNTSMRFVHDPETFDRLVASHGEDHFRHCPKCGG